MDSNDDGVDLVIPQPVSSSVHSAAKASSSVAWAGQDKVDHGLAAERRPSTLSANSSFNGSRSATKELYDVSTNAIKELQQTWVRTILFCSGGLHEHKGVDLHWTKAVLVVVGLMHCGVPPGLVFLCGVPGPLCLLFYISYAVFIVPAVFVRGKVLRSGLIQSLIDPDKHKHLLQQFNTECRLLMMGLAGEALLLNTLCAIVIFNVQLERVQQLFGSSRVLFGIVFPLNVVGHWLAMCIAKLLPILLRLVCSVLIEDLQTFKREVDALFMDNPRAEEINNTALCDELHSMELSVRRRLAAANETMGPVVMAVAASNLIVVVGLLQLLVNAIKLELHPLLMACFVFVISNHSTWLVSVLQTVAKVADSWNHIVEDFNTPALCAATASVLSGVPLAERLGQLRYMGVTMFDCTVTSSTVTSVGFTLGSGLFLTALGGGLFLSG